jgi:DnaJ-class molecular chaperone
MSVSKNYYDILGVTSLSTQDEIKKAYRKLSLEYHPDRNKNGNNLMASINEAYNVLSNEQLKNEYDFQQNTNINLKEMFRNPQADEFIQMLFSNGNPFDIFKQPHDLQKPAPIIKNITVTIYQIYTGVTIPIEIERWIYENGTKVFEKETIYVIIPQGIDENEIIILKEKGNIMNFTNIGDIKLFVKVINDTEYKRNGLDLIYKRTISLKDALCGFSLQFTFLNGKTYTLNNSLGNIITPEYKKIIPSMGITRGTHQGNLIIFFHVEFPETLSDNQVTVLKNIL